MTCRILLADDELHILRAAEFKMKSAGYEVICAGDGQDAWEKLNQHEVDVVVTDLQMPRLDGLELIAKIRESAALHDLPVILLTAKGFEITEDEPSFQALNIFRLVTKPFSPRQLTELVGQASETRASDATSRALA